jgi:hypothetical protein
VPDIRCFFLEPDPEGRKSDGLNLFRRMDTGELMTLRDAPVGAMWDVSWYKDTYYHKPNYDGIHLAIRTPGGTWDIESRANNCTMPDDDTHRCWIRHGTVPDITVDKDGLTCGAGAGSILSGGYHGFLRQGVLVDC